MRRAKFFSIFLLAFFAAGPVARAQQHPAQSAPAPAPWNDNPLIAIQKQSGDPSRPGDVKIDFYGHDAFKITSPSGITVLADPWRNDATSTYPKWFLREFPAIPIDIVLSTHAHFDHDAVERPNALMVLERMVGRYNLGDVAIWGLADKHQCDPESDKKSDASSQTCPPNNVPSFDNAIQIIQTGGLRIAIWGDNRGVPDASLDRYLKNIDVLILPVQNVLGPAEADAIIRKYDPRAVIPSHYFISGLSTTTSGLEPVEAWVTDQEKNQHADVRRLDRADLTLNPAELKGAQHRIYYFADHYQEK
jgi:L-ascorbate metabolism protein UlaG (beta-lactamase superfamily)